MTTLFIQAIVRDMLYSSKQSQCEGGILSS
jgi:hypothetical protein